MTIDERIMDLDLDVTNMSNIINARQKGIIVYIRGNVSDKDEDFLETKIIITGSGMDMCEAIFTACKSEPSMFDVLMNVVGLHLKDNLAQKDRDEFINYINEK